MKKKFLLLIMLLIYGSFFKPSLAFSGTNQDYYESKLHIEKAKLLVTKYYSRVKAQDLEIIMDQSGAHGVTYINNMKYYPGYFHFRLTSSIKSEKINNLLINHFAACSVGIFENGEFWDDKCAVNIFTASSCKSDKFSTAKKLSLSFYLVTVDEICFTLSSYKKKDFEGYIGKNIQISCYTEGEVPIEQALIFIENVLAKNNVKLIEQSNKIKAIYTDSHN